MHEALQLLIIAGVILLGVASPGPNFAIVTSMAMRVSRQAGLVAAFGMAAASGTWALCVVAGAGVMAARFPEVYAAVRIGGAAYLIWLGAKMVLGARRRLEDGRAEDIPRGMVFRRACLASMTNPKSIAFYGSVLAVAVPVHAPAWFNVLVVIIAAAVSLAWYCTVALLFSHGTVRRAFARTKTAMEVTMGAVLVALGVRLFIAR